MAGTADRARPDARKQKVSVTIDAGLEVRSHPGGISARLNDALRAELARRHDREARIEQVWREPDAAAGTSGEPKADHRAA